MAASRRFRDGPRSSTAAPAADASTHGMGLVAFGAPGIDRYHLHERLQRELRSRGHAVAWLALDEAEATFFCHQGAACSPIAGERPDGALAPLDEIAQVEYARLGLAEGGRRHRRCRAASCKRLARWLPGLCRWFDRQRPDLVLLHQRRTAEQALVQFVARQCGTRVLWTGDGLLPHTQQCDERGLDGDALASHRAAIEFRDARAGPGLLQACLANLLARVEPSALSRAEVRQPVLGDRLRGAAAALLRGRPAAARTALIGWRQALAPEPQRRAPFTLPHRPFVAVLLQDRDDPRVRLDAPLAPAPGPLAAAARAAADALDPALGLAVVLPAAGLARSDRHTLAAVPRAMLLPACAAPEAAATALTTVTISHPLAAAALLSGTPVVHFGRALYGLPGVTQHARVDELAAALGRAVAADEPTLRERFLSWLFTQAHLWCSPTHPDHNGLCGLVQAIEVRLGPRAGPRPPYRVGPAWPLAAEGRTG